MASAVPPRRLFLMATLFAGLFLTLAGTGPSSSSHAAMNAYDPRKAQELAVAGAGAGVAVNPTPTDAVFLGKTFTPRSAEERRRGMKVGVGIMIHRGESKFKEHGVSSGMFDAIAVMTAQIGRFRPYMKHRVQQIAFLSNQTRESAPLLERLGWATRNVELMVQPADIRNPQISKEVWTDGALGIWEMLKLEAWRRAVVGMDLDLLLMVDTDIHFRQPFDAVFDWLAPGQTFAYTEGDNDSWKGEQTNGGFLLLRPGEHAEGDYHAIMEILKEGDFRPGTGWKGMTGWTYGGRTMQGLLAYYYIYGAGKDRALHLNRCLIDNMAQSKECNTVAPADVISNHFTGGCQKPWTCLNPREPQCAGFHKQYWADRAAARTYLSLPQGQDGCVGGKYEGLGLDGSRWSLPAGHLQ